MAFPRGDNTTKNTPTISFSSLRAGAAAGVTPQDVDTQPIQYPATLDYLTKFPSWQMLGNDKWGDCVAVAWANMRRITTATLTRKEVYPSLQDVFQVYRRQNPNFSEQTVPGSSDDRGMDAQLMLESMVKDGGPDGVKAVCFASVNPKSMDDIHAAISVFGSVYVRIVVSEPGNDDDFRNKRVWSYHPNQKLGGHAVLVGGYLPNQKCVTWGSVAEFGPDYWQNGVTHVWAVCWPEHFGTKSFMRGIDIQQMAAQYKKLTKTDIVFPPAPFSRFFFVKTRNTGSGTIEVHCIDEQSSYANPTLHSASGYRQDDGDNGTWDLDGDDLYFVKTRNCGSGTIELHTTTATSSYHDFSLHTPTGFGLADANNGFWEVDNGSLYFIKTKNCGSGFVEVHRIDGPDWKAFNAHDVTDLPQQQAGTGTWRIHGGNLWWIQPNQGHVKVTRWNVNNQYKNPSSFDTVFTEYENSTWDIGPRNDLYRVKTQNTAKQHVELYVSTWESGFKDQKGYVTWFSEGDANNGVWCVR